MKTATKSTPMEKQWNLLEADAEKVANLQEALGVPPVFAHLLVQRGIETFEQARRFFRPDWSHLHDPFLMQDMDKAVSRLAQAIQNEEKILLYGDYDVDGTTSVALMYSFLRKLHQHLDYYIPDRYKEGYGVSFEGIEYAQQQSVGLIIAMDCGINAVDQARRANQYGIDMIICDHHLPGASLPEATAVLDPKRSDCGYPFKELSGCGVAFKLAQAYALKNELKEEQLHELLDLLVISIASDIVPIVDENRVLAKFGLEKLNATERPGLQALIARTRREPPLTISDIVFGIGPMINAAGRLADAEQAVRLMLAGEGRSATEYAQVLEYRNTMRREFDERIAEEAVAMWESDKAWQQKRAIVLYKPHWHKGIVGIVAARMVERYHRPAIILTESEGKIVGSARSVRGFDIYEALGMCSDLLLSFGGHAHAAGLSMARESVIFFQDRFEAAVDTLADEAVFVPELRVSAEIQLEEITPKFWRILRQFAPFGPGNRNPVFLCRGVRDTGYSRLLRGNHLRLAVGQPGSQAHYGVAFGRGDDMAKVRKRKPFDICFTLEENRWQGKANLQLMVKDMKF
jgi:single-stranded-DNA-specific exonuclease